MLVVAAAIFDKGELLAARRISPAEHAGKYELPGGKVEEGEDPRAALAREIAEELGVEIEIDEDPFNTTKVAKGLRKPDTFLFFRCTLKGPRPLRSTDHDALVWLQRDFWITGVDWLEIDWKVVAELKELGPL